MWRIFQIPIRLLPWPLRNLTTVVLVGAVPTVIAVVAQVLGLHTHTVVTLEHGVRTHRLRLCEENEALVNLSLEKNAKSKVQTEQNYQGDYSC